MKKGLERADPRPEERLRRGGTAAAQPGPRGPFFLCHTKEVQGGGGVVICTQDRNRGKGKAATPVPALCSRGHSGSGRCALGRLSRPPARGGRPFRAAPAGWGLPPGPPRPLALSPYLPTPGSRCSYERTKECLGVISRPRLGAKHPGFSHSLTFTPDLFSSGISRRNQPR